MKNTDIPQIRAWFKDYTEAFFNNDELNNVNIKLKIDHSCRVLERMEEIADDLKLAGKRRRIALACALLHDIGRFEQFKRYRTFADMHSEDHGRLGKHILDENSVLSGLSPRAADIIGAVVEYHNAKFLPENLSAEKRFYVELTRDADKIDILKVVCDYYTDETENKDRTIVHNLPDGDDISDEVYLEFMHDGHVTFSKMKSVLDFKIFQIGWVWDINNRAALRILDRLGYVDTIISTLADTERCRAAADKYREFISVLKEEDKLGWTELSRTRLHDCRIFTLYSSERESSEGTRSTAYMIDAPDWVTIVPRIEKDGEEFFVMVKQYRHGSMRITTEFPAGTLEPGEESEDAALRELTEETGYRAGKITWLGSVNPNPAFLNNTFTAYLAEELVQTGSRNLDDNEYIDYELIRVQDVIKRMGSGEYSNGTMLMALMYYMRETGMNNGK